MATINAPVAEDDAGDGGEVCETFSNYIAPLWAVRATATVSTTPTTPAVTNQRKEVIVLDSSDDEDDDSILKVDFQETAAHDHEKNNNKDVTNIPSHSSPACESGLLAAVTAPEPSDECLCVVRDLAQEGKLSPLQVEGVGLAIQRHCRLLSSNEGMVRAGFFLGDGAGIGKGRQIAAVLRDSLSRSVRETTQSNHGSKMVSSKRRRHLWISVSRELIEDARRDLKDVGCHVPVVDGADVLGGSTTKKSISTDSGVLFITYAFLVTGKGRRMNNIIAWLTHGNKGCETDFDGCIMFDEAHKAKNLCADPPTATGLLVLQLQERLTNARVMYCSATGVSNLKQLGYATRLGLWGAGTNFPTFDSFRGALEKRGVGAMEMLALEMKQAGCFVARTLSWDGALFETVKVQLTPEQIRCYDESILWWNRVKCEIRSAIKPNDMNGTPKLLWSHYWSALQRFAKELTICIKVPLISKAARKELENGHSIVIGLQSTGEASTQTTLEELQAQRVAHNLPVKDLEDLALPSILSTASAIMASFIRNHFPVAPLPPDPIKVPTVPPGGFTNDHDRMIYEHLTIVATREKNAPPPAAKPELLRKKQDLLNDINNIPLPPSPLDDLIDRLGGAHQVSEMTGRSGRILRSKSNSFKFVRRVGISKEKKFGLSMPCSQEDSDRLNVAEKKKFMDGRKNVAIISDAASVGISLHSKSGTGACNRRRIHYTIELPWAADKAIQQLGRTNRSGQISSPIYKMVVTELGGERRFAAAIAKRMAGLGALTKGDRRAATGSDFSEFDVDSRYGKRSLRRLYDCMTAQPPYTPSKTSNVHLDNYLMDLEDAELLNLDQTDKRIFALEQVQQGLEMIGISSDSDARDKGDVKVFLNRIAALPVATQNLVFRLFTSTIEDVIAEAKNTGEYEGSVEQISATSIELSSQEIITIDASSGALTKMACFELDRGCPFTTVCNLCLSMIPSNFPAEKNIELNNSVAMSGFYISKREVKGRKLIVFAKRKIQMTEEDEADSANRIESNAFDLMVLTRPNTGTNPCEMHSEELCRKYQLVSSVDDAKNLLLDNASSNSPHITLPALLSEKFPILTKMWQCAYNLSNTHSIVQGLAPRRSSVAMVTGSVLHCLPILEKVVASMKRQTDRTLKVIRVELSINKQCMVGVKFPMNEIALQNLRGIAATLSSKMNTNKSFLDERPALIQVNSVSWLTTPPVSMKSFFKSGTKRNAPDSSSRSNSKYMPASIGGGDATSLPLKMKVQRTARGKKSVIKTNNTITSFFKMIKKK